MANPVTKIRNTAADYRKLDGRNTCQLYILPILPIVHFLFPAMSYTFRIYKISMLLPRN